MNLSKVVGQFVEEQKTVNAQTTQKIETWEGTFNKRLHGLQYSVSRLTTQQQMQEKGKFPSKKQPNLSGLHEERFSSDSISKLNEVKAIITLRVDFLNKNPDEAMDFLNYVAETSKAWDEPNLRETDRHKSPMNPKGGIFSLSEEMEMKAKLSSLTRRLEELELRNQHEV